MTTIVRMDCGFPKKGATERPHHQYGLETDTINEAAVTKAGNVAGEGRGPLQTRKWLADREGGTKEEQGVVWGARVVECAHME